MIGRLSGELIETQGPLVLVDVQGVGYEVTVPESVLVQLPQEGEAVRLYTRQIFREDGVSLYGFVQSFERRIFDHLMEVKGCGPKVALAMIGQIGAEAVASAIVAQDAKVLTRANGVGARLAERILLELKDKMAEETFQRRVLASTEPKATRQAPDDLVDALLNLGYRRSEAEFAAEDARGQAETVEEQLRLALRSLQRS